MSVLNLKAGAADAAEAVNKKNRKKPKKWIVVLAVVLVLAVAASVVLRKKAPVPSMEDLYTTSEVAVRDITNALTGSGTLQPADSYTVTTLVSGEILSDHFEEGDWVEEDQLLYVIDSSDASSTQTQAQRNYEDAVKSKYPTADASGLVSEVYVRNGDSVSAGTQLCKIVAPTAASVLLAFGISAGIGVMFGYLPAKKAARLNPIDALRYD